LSFVFKRNSKRQPRQGKRGRKKADEDDKDLMAVTVSEDSTQDFDAVATRKKASNLSEGFT
jgi:hypothetical protein